MAQHQLHRRMPRRDSEATRCQGADQKDHLSLVLHDQSFRGLPARGPADAEAKDALGHRENSREV